MNEETPKKEPEKTGLDEKRKNALLRYIAILFAVAFLLVLISLISQMRNSQDTITELNQSSSSAVQKAEQLQDHNRILEENNSLLKGQISDLEEQVEQLEAQLQEAEVQRQVILNEKTQLANQSREISENQELAYELLLQFSADHSPETRQKLETYKHYLGTMGLETYHAIVMEMEKGE